MGRVSGMLLADSVKTRIRLLEFRPELKPARPAPTVSVWPAMLRLGDT
jgi:hypothetical protein